MRGCKRLQALHVEAVQRQPAYLEQRVLERVQPLQAVVCVPVAASQQVRWCRRSTTPRYRRRAVALQPPDQPLDQPLDRRMLLPLLPLVLVLMRTALRWWRDGALVTTGQDL